MMVRSCLFLMSLGLLAACNRTPSFDERYEKQANMLEGSANTIEQEVERQISGAAATERASQEIVNGAGGAGGR